MSKLGNLAAVAGVILVYAVIHTNDDKRAVAQPPTPYPAAQNADGSRTMKTGAEPDKPFVPSTMAAPRMPRMRRPAVGEVIEPPKHAPQVEAEARRCLTTVAKQEAAKQEGVAGYLSRGNDCMYKLTQNLRANGATECQINDYEAWVGVTVFAQAHPGTFEKLLKPYAWSMEDHDTHMPIAPDDPRCHAIDGSAK